METEFFVNFRKMLKRAYISSYVHICGMLMDLIFLFWGKSLFMSPPGLLPTRIFTVVYGSKASTTIHKLNALHEANTTKGYFLYFYLGKYTFRNRLIIGIWNTLFKYVDVDHICYIFRQFHNPCLRTYSAHLPTSCRC